MEVIRLKPHCTLTQPLFVQNEDGAGFKLDTPVIGWGEKYETTFTASVQKEKEGREKYLI